MLNNLVNETGFLFKIGTLFFVLGLGMVSPKFLGEFKNNQKITLNQKISSETSPGKSLFIKLKN